MNNWDHIDSELLEELREVMGADLEQLLTAFVDNAVVQFDAMQQAIEGEDAEALKKLVHTAKGAAASVGATSVSRRLLELERRATNGVFGGAVQGLALSRLALDAYQRELVFWRQQCH